MPRRSVERRNGRDELVKMWMKCGLVDEKRKPGQGLGIWDAWLKLPRK